MGVQVVVFFQYGNMVPLDVLQIGAAAKGQGHFKFVAQQAQHMGHALRPRMGQAERDFTRSDRL
jgi:hypothetical protein